MGQKCRRKLVVVTVCKYTVCESAATAAVAAALICCGNPIFYNGITLFCASDKVGVGCVIDVSIEGGTNATAVSKLTVILNNECITALKYDNQVNGIFIYPKYAQWTIIGVDGTYCEIAVDHF